MKGQPTPKLGDILEGLNFKKPPKREWFITGVKGEGLVTGFSGNKIVVYYSGLQYAVLKEKLVSAGPGRWTVPPKKSSRK